MGRNSEFCFVEVCSWTDTSFFFLCKCSFVVYVIVCWCWLSLGWCSAGAEIQNW